MRHKHPMTKGISFILTLCMVIGMTIAPAFAGMSLTGTVDNFIDPVKVTGVEYSHNDVTDQGTLTIRGTCNTQYGANTVIWGGVFKEGGVSGPNKCQAKGSTQDGELGKWKIVIPGSTISGKTIGIGRWILRLDLQGSGAGTNTVQNSTKYLQTTFEVGADGQIVDMSVFDMPKAAQTTPVAISLSGSTASVGQTAAVTAAAVGGGGTGAYEYFSGDSAIASIDAAGNITIKKAGTVTFAAMRAGDADFEPSDMSADATLTVSAGTQTITGSAFQPVKSNTLLTLSTSDFNLQWKDAAGRDIAPTNRGTIEFYSDGGGSSQITTLNISSPGVQIIYAKALAVTDYYTASPIVPLTVDVQDLLNQTITFDQAGPIAKTYGDDPFANEASIVPTSPGGGQTITYASSNTNVATVESSSGRVTIVGAGTATITASALATSTHAGDSASYTLNVSPKALSLYGTATKVYDGTDTLTLGQLDSSARLDGVRGSDTGSVELDTLTASYSSANVHTSQDASVTGVTLRGAKAANYSITSSAVTIKGSITPLELSGHPGFSLTTDNGVVGTAEAGDVYTATLGSITGPALDLSTHLDIQWLRGGAAISGETSATYTVTREDYDKAITVQVKARTGGNYSTVSPLISTVSDTPGRAPLGGTLTINVSGSGMTTASGGALSLDLSGLTPVTVTESDLTYTWYRDGSLIGGANTTTYAIQKEDLGTTISAIVTAKQESDFGGTVEAAGKQVSPYKPTNVKASLSEGNGSLTGTWSAQRNGSDVTYIYELTFNSKGTTTKKTSYEYNDGTTQSAIVTDGAVGYTFTSGSATWIDPSGGGATSGSAVYEVTSTTDASVTVGAGIVTVASGSGVTETTKVFGSLSNNVEYTLTVTASNIAGPSDVATAKGTPKAGSSGGNGGHGGGGGGGSVSTYTVTYDAGDHGKIDKKTETVSNGNSPKGVTVTADEGWAFVGWSINGKKVVDLKDIKVTESMKLIALYEKSDKIVIPKSMPDDLRFLQKSKEEIKGGYISGYSNGTFRPDNPISRAEVAAILAKVINYEKEEGKSYTNTPFGDVKSSEWYADDLGFLASLGITEGYTDGTYHPNSNITRAEFVTMVTKIDGLVNGTRSFSDVKSGDWYAEYVQTAAAKNYSAGYKDGTFRPNNAITRAEAVTIINAVLGLETGRGEMLFTDVPANHWAYSQIQTASSK